MVPAVPSARCCLNPEPRTLNPYACGWSLKKLHRLIMLSRAYQESSAYNPAAAAKDPGNRLFWRYNRWRLEAEFVRDNALFATPVTLGATFTFGNPEKLFEPEAADLVLGYDVGRDAQRFLVVQRGANQNSAKIVIVENWTSSLHAIEPAH